MQTFLNKNYFFGPLAINFFTCLIALLAQVVLPPQIPLFYGLPVSTEQLSPSLGLLIPGGLGIVINSANLLLWLKIKDNYLKRILLISSYIVSFFAVITTIKIIFLVGSL
jgi:hypothetical protein